MTADDGMGTSGSDVLPQLGPALSDKERQARETIAEDRYNSEAWTSLAAEAQSRSVNEASTVALWEFFFATFPTAGKWWKVYVEAHMAAGNDEEVKQIFGRCLLSCPYLDLWRCYIRYIRQTKDDQPDGREDIRKAMEFALDHVGLDIGAGLLWEEYIKFLKSAPAANSQEESQRMGIVRKAYQRAVLCPVLGVELLWKEYDAYEMGISRALAKGLLAEYQPRYAAARAVSRERKKLMDKINLLALPLPLVASMKDEQQSVAWAELLAYERKNPQRLPEPAWVKSVLFAYDQCLMSLRLHPHVWYDYATWHAQNNNPDAAVLVFQRALAALPESAVLHFAYAELQEGRGRIQEAKAIYEALLNNEATASSLAHIQMMRFVRRTEGMEAARQAFLAARKAVSSSYHVHVASALMELCTNKDAKVARNVLELGLKKYIHTPSYVLEYADFLEKMNDERNIRALFERALSVLPPDKSQEVWCSFVECERLYGDLDSLLKLEQRKRAALAKESEEGTEAGSMEEAVARYSFRDLLPCSPAELAHVSHLKNLLENADEGKQAPSKARGITADGEEKGPGTDVGILSEAPRLNIVRPDTSQMAVYDPRQGLGGPMAGMPVVAAQPGLAYGSAPPGLPMMAVPAASMIQHSIPMPMQLPSGVVAVPGSGTTPMTAPPQPQVASPVMQSPTPSSAVVVAQRSSGSPLLPSVPSPDGTGTALQAASIDDNTLALLPPSLALFLASLPWVPGPYPDVDFVISVLLQTDIPHHSSANAATLSSPPLSSTGNQAMDVSLPVSGISASGQSTHSPVQAGRPPTTTKRKETEKTDEPCPAGAPPPRDLYRWRLLQKARGASGAGGGSSFSGGTHSGTYSSDRVSNSSG